MCQAYEGERNFILRTEDRYTREGYEAAKSGKPKEVPNQIKGDLYYEPAWLHGYGCFEEGIVPYAVEKNAPHRG